MGWDAVKIVLHTNLGLWCDRSVSFSYITLEFSLVFLVSLLLLPQFTCLSTAGALRSSTAVRPEPGGRSQPLIRCPPCYSMVIFKREVRYAGGENDYRYLTEFAGIDG